MKITLNLTGPVDDVLAGARAQLAEQASHQAGAGPVAEGAAYLVAQELNGVAPGTEVAIAVTLAIVVTKPGVVAHEQ